MRPEIQWNRPVALLIILTTLIVGGYKLGHKVATLFTGNDTPAPVVTVTTPQAPKPAAPPSTPAPRLRGVRFERSRPGAAAAAAKFSTRMIGVAFSGRRVREATYARIATRRARAGLVALADSSQQVAQRNLAGGPGPVVLRVTPIGYRIVSFTPSRAVVDLWTLGIAGGRVRQPTASFGSTIVTLQWEQGGWRLDGFQNGPGLTPNVAPTTANPAAVLADQDKYLVYGTLTP